MATIRVFPLLSVGLCLHRQIQRLKRDYPPHLAQGPETGPAFRALTDMAQDDIDMLLQAAAIVGKIEEHREEFDAIFWCAKNNPLAFASMAATARGLKRG